MTATTAPIWTMLILSGAKINGVQVTLYALAAHVYPVAMRATGVGAAASFGRIGGVLSSYLSAWAIQAGGSSRFILVIAAILGGQRRRDCIGVTSRRASARICSSRSVRRSLHFLTLDCAGALSTPAIRISQVSRVET